MPLRTSAVMRLAGRVAPRRAPARGEAASRTDSAVQRVTTRRCGHGGASFEPVRRHQRFCRPPCRAQGVARRTNEGGLLR